MHSKPNQAKEVGPAEAETNRVIGQVRQRLGIAELSELDAADLSARLARHLAALPDDERRVMRRDLAIAAHDLEGLVAALEAEMGQLASELKALHQRTDAARAYGRAAATVVPLRRI